MCHEDPLTQSSSIGDEPASEKRSVRMDAFMEFFQCGDSTTWTEEITCALCSDKGNTELPACSSPGSCHDKQSGSFVPVLFLAEEKQRRTKKGGNTDQIQKRVTRSTLRKALCFYDSCITAGESTEAKGDEAQID